jgi:GNAT superfamily N-acetyltransferase
MSEPVPVRRWERPDGYVVSTDRALLDFDVIHGYLARSYWSPGVERERVERAARNSLCYGLYAPDGGQAGYARVITDRATFAYLADVFVLEAHRGQGRGVFLAECAVMDPDLQDLRRFMLFTRDAHGLYERFGFGPLAAPERGMQRLGRAAGVCERGA